MMEKKNVLGAPLEEHPPRPRRTRCKMDRNRGKLEPKNVKDEDGEINPFTQSLFLNDSYGIGRLRITFNWD